MVKENKYERCCLLNDALFIFPEQEAALIRELCQIRTAAMEKNAVYVNQLITDWIDLVGSTKLENCALYKMMIGSTEESPEYWKSLPLDTSTNEIEKFIREKLKLENIPAENN